MLISRLPLARAVAGFLLFTGLSVASLAQGFNLTVEATPAVTPGLTTYRFYVDMNDATDRMSAVFGNNANELSINTPDGAFNSTFNSSWNASGINPAFVTVFPDLVDDTYATIGLDGPASSSGLAGAADPSVVEDSEQPITPYFLTDGATLLLSNTLTGASYYILNTASNGLPDENMRVLILQVTTGGSISGTMQAQVFPLGIGADQQLLSWDFDGAGTYGGGVEDVPGCTDAAACNFDAEANVDDGSCSFAEEFYTCEGECQNDADGDGVCDELEVSGCADNSACNYDPEATDNDGCTYPEETYLDCAGDCLNDEDGDGVCDEVELGGCTDAEACNYNAEATDDDGSCDFTSCIVSGCTDALACNYDAAASEDDGSCDYCSCQRAVTTYTLVVEGEPAVVAGMTTYRLYVTLPDEGDRMSAVFGNDENGLLVEVPSGAFNSTFNTSWNASGINPAFLPAFPELASDTYATIGLDGPASASGLEGTADPSVVEDPNQPITPFFLEDGATTLESNTITGASWYILNTASNGLADENGRVLLMQITTEGGISGQLNYQVFPLGVGADQEQLSIAFDGVGVFGGDEPTVTCGCTDAAAANYDAEATYDDGSCVYDVPGCTDEMACNYNGSATEDDGSCVFCDCGAEEAPDYTLTVEASEAVQEGLMTYRFYVNMMNMSDKLSAVYGNNEEGLRIQTPGGVFNSDLNASWNASGLASAFVALYPEMADDTYATIGLTGPASEAGAGAVNPDLAEWDQSPLTIASYFTTGGVDLDISSAVGGIWYIPGPASNAEAGETGRVLAMQVTTSGAIYGTLNTQIFPEGDGTQEFKLSWTFAGEGIYDADGYGNACGCTDPLAGNYDPTAVYDDGTCVFGVPGCTDAEACNYDGEATLDDGSCVLAEPGYTCEGECIHDADGDGVCDEFEVLGCTNPEALNFDPASTDDDGSCEVMGCTYADANNYNPAATDDDGSCEFDLSGGGCLGDFDNSGLVQLADLLDFLLVYGTYCDE